jgi:hypothetical protein
MHDCFKLNAERLDKLRTYHLLQTFPLQRKDPLSYDVRGRGFTGAGRAVYTSLLNCTYLFLLTGSSHGMAQS